MMTEDEVVQRIIRLYKDENGFLVKLRVGIEFDEQLYQESVQAIKDYISLAKGKEYISRHVAFFLYETVFVLEGQAQYLGKSITLWLKELHKRGKRLTDCPKSCFCKR